LLPFLFVRDSGFPVKKNLEQKIQKERASENEMSDKHNPEWKLQRKKKKNETKHGVTFLKKKGRRLRQSPWASLYSAAAAAFSSWRA